MFLIFEGANKSGKSSLIKAFHLSTNYKYSVIDRFSLTSYAFGKAQNRDLDYNSYFSQDLKLCNDAIIVYTYCDKETLRKRFIEHNEKDIDLEKEYDTMKALYEEYLDKTPLFKVMIDTTQPIEDCVRLIKIAIEMFEKEPIENKVNRLIKTIELLGDKVSNTKELRDVELIYNHENTSTLKEYLYANKLYLESEEDEYNMIYYDLKNEIRLKLNYFKTQDINSRQFIYHGSSCISLVQLLLRNKVLEVHVTIRSSDTKKTLLNDIHALSKIAQKLRTEYFDSSYVPDIRYYLHLNNAHVYL